MCVGAKKGRWPDQVGLLSLRYWCNVDRDAGAAAGWVLRALDAYRWAITFGISHAPIHVHDDGVSGIPDIII